ncbi:hypothetical protein A6770_38345 [Nostoc minutum NIES-26]|uniref:Low-complexity protein n=1 Tax=Nostoc minutum NIES-26 TaxID=1844469 RepID=A0A367RWN2_9NOSO|nr:hypothetical protein A6770_38345 [Nostoc minutum NIES-26]
MANEEHLAILRQGVEVWNQWRQNFPAIKPNLQHANLSKVNLIGANFFNTDLEEVLLHDADMTEANLIEANLCSARLWNANLCKANLTLCHLRNANFSEANLSKANLSRANLCEVNFWRANLNSANLTEANLKEANLSETNLTKVILSRVNLNGADLRKANLNSANLIGTDIRKANFNDANFSEVIFTNTNLSGLNLSELNFSSANLTDANLNKIQALGTNFTSATFTGACIQDWHINSATNFTGVICDYIYLRQNQQERRPSSGNFAPGEFTKLFQKSLETIDLIFRNGIDWDAFAYSFKKVEVENQGTPLDVQSIEKKGGGILVVRVAVASDADKAKIHSEFMQGYEFAAKALEAQYQARLEDKDALIARQESQINRLFDIVEQQGSVQKALAENPRKVSNYDQRYSQFAGGNVDANIVNADQIGGNIQNNNA